MDLKKIERILTLSDNQHKVNTNLILSLSVIVNKPFDRKRRA